MSRVSCVELKTARTTHVAGEGVEKGSILEVRRILCNLMGPDGSSSALDCRTSALCAPLAQDKRDRASLLDQ